MLGPILRSGMRVLDFGAAMGIYSLPAARMVGESGHLTAMDLQPRMLAELRRRAARAGIASRIDTVQCTPEDLGLLPAGPAYDVVLVIHVLHEVPDQAKTLRQLAEVLVPGGLLVLLEPPGHVKEAEFARELADAERAGLTVDREIDSRQSRGRVLKKRA
jgi:2-polyprenyl-3-methyl-5-hydroxy-6-metoxy-1,4-benzoquinol methylase